jgi:hypothetical protein
MDNLIKVLINNVIDNNIFTLIFSSNEHFYILFYQAEVFIAGTISSY